MLTGPGFQSGPYFPNRQAPPHLTMHRSRPSIVPANVPLPSTPNIAQLAFNPGLSIFPGTQPPPGPSVGRSGVHPYPPRRQPSISIGGPPKAVLGGPRKVDATSASDVGPGALLSLAGGVVEVPKPKSKKCIVKLPIESPSTAGSSTGEILRPPWARNPLRIPVSDELDGTPPPNIITIEIYPELGSSGAHPLPSTIEVFLPGKGAWEEYKNQIIEEKLAKLGVEKGNRARANTFVPTHAPMLVLPRCHWTRAFLMSLIFTMTRLLLEQVSSPADPALLLFKLNKLQQSQSLRASPGTSEASSSGMSNYSKHAHSMSLAHPALSSASFFTPPTGSPSHFVSPLNASMPELSPFGTQATFGQSDYIIPPHLKRSPLPSSSLRSVSETGDDEEEEKAVADDSDERQDDGWLPMFAPQPQAPIQSDPKPDFTVGFGLDVTSDDEEDIRPFPSVKPVASSDAIGLEDVTPNNTVPDNYEYGEDEIDPDIDDGITEGAFITPSHSRQPSKVSVPVEPPRNFIPQETVQEEESWVPQADDGDEKENIPPSHGESAWSEGPDHDGPDTDDWTNPSQPPREPSSADEWTESEAAGRNEADLVSDSESTGEWSNPSDEERHRQDRRLRRQLATAARRTPQFLQYPSASIGSTFGFGIPPPPTQQRFDDIISNPSEEGIHDHSAYFSASDPDAFYPTNRSDNGSVRAHRPLPLPPRSEGNSLAPTPPPALRSGAHSRSASYAAQDRLNPLAKPFVFGGSLGVGHSPEQGVPYTHARETSQGSRLNAAAAEFKPSFVSTTGFNFKPPPGVPALSFSSGTSDANRPLPIPPSSSRAAQGREKRQRRGSGAGFLASDGPAEDGRDQIAHFQFPPQSAPLEPPTIVMPRRGSMLNPAAKPFTFNGSSAVNSATAAATPGTSASAPATIPASLRSKRSADGMDDEAEEAKPTSLTDTPATPVRSPDWTKARRPPIPDFQHPVSTNTVPASVFKALVNGDGEGPTRPTVRSRLSSRELLFETHGHVASLDDINLPSIARRANRTVSQAPSTSPFGTPLVDVFTQSPQGARDDRIQSRSDSSMGGPSHHGRLASLVRSATPSDIGETKRANIGDLASRLSHLVDEFSSLRRDIFTLRLQATAQATEPSPSALRSAFSDFIPVLQTQLQTQLAEHRESIATENSRDAQGELDYELIHNLIEQGHHELRASLQRDIAELAQALEQQSNPSRHVYQLIEELSSRTINAVNTTASKIVTHFTDSEENSRRRPVEERKILLQELLNHLVPHINTLRSEPLDLDRVTMQLTQAVKPHISQLIDLASDKKETAALITQHLLPVLTSIIPPSIDTPSIATRLSSDLVKAMPHLDSHDLKEEIADLVVERLDSRLAIRASASNNTETLSSRIVESLAPHLERSNQLSSAFESLSSRNETLQFQYASLQASQSDVVSKLSLLPDVLTGASWAVTQAQTELVAKTRALKHVASLMLLQGEQNALVERLSHMEMDRKDGSEELAALRERSSSRDTDLASAESRIVQLEQDVSEAMIKLGDAENSLSLSDVELQLSLATRDLDASKQIRMQIEAQRDDLLSQQSHWQDLRRTADHVEMLTKGELSTLQKLHSDQEFKLGNMQRASITFKQSIANAQQRAAEWEKKAKEHEHELETCRFKLQQNEEVQVATVAELESYKRQVEEHDGIERASKAHPDILTGDSASVLRIGLEHAQASSSKRIPYPTYPTPQSSLVSYASSEASNNGRPLSRLSQSTQSTEWPSRPGTATPDRARTHNGKHTLPNQEPPQESVWDSMHAPDLDQVPPTPRASHKSTLRLSLPPSPTFSTVSVTPTQGPDGWWE
ncbi:hypothetical protein BS47DRAFT_1393681 [Hydnum rufescens UP504]|uniref:Uncharacterized protein n=1 Tax=Hydnum rufescens UP504 TaxID=1448309 RepID=A0A9P6AW75_9AGAM|nr:hypothetical protein BS47DRAFT_1393681 [Hydnum rufescens UP504]